MTRLRHPKRFINCGLYAIYRKVAYGWTTSSIAIDARMLPTVLLSLKPCPLHAEQIITCGIVGKVLQSSKAVSDFRLDIQNENG